MSARSYLDHAATSPVRPEVAEQVARDLADGLAGRANPAATHASGWRAGALLAQARARLAAALGVDAHEILLTSGGTEADGLVVVGRALAAVRAGMDRPRIVISAVEHPAVADSARLAERLGARVEVVGVDRAGLVDPGKVAGAVEAGGTALVSVMAANNETGAVQDVPGIVTAVRQVTGAARPASPLWVPVHCDAVAALGRVPVDPGRWGLDAMTLTGHKLGAPVGVGALVARRELALAPPTGGGRQERGLRSGTQDVIGARALALAVELAVGEQAEQAERLEALRTRLLGGASRLEGVHATLPAGTAHLPSTAHLHVDGVDPEALLMALDMAGIDVSAGSACHAGVAGPSAVMLAMGFDEAASRSTLRCSMGATTTASDVERFLAALPPAVEVARRAAPAGS